MLRKIRLLTAGESHGPALTAVLEGLPAGLALSVEDIDGELSRRQVGYGSGGRMKIEKDRVRILSGVMNGMTTGAPITLVVDNDDYENWRARAVEPMTKPRPGHADLTAAIKYGYRDLRLALERASARETTMRVAAGAVARKLLGRFGIEICGYVTQIGGVRARIDAAASPDGLRKATEASELRCPDEAASAAMREAVRQARKDQDTLGGVFEVVCFGAPPGLGSHVHYDRRLDAALAGAMMSIQAMKGVEIGDGFTSAARRGSEAHDEIFAGEGGALRRTTNRAGGIEGGISSGEPIVVRVAMKPIATVLRGLRSVDLHAGQEAATEYERSDFCAVPRAVPIGEAMMALVVADALLDKLGGDSIEEMRPRFDALRKARLQDLPMDGDQWFFRYA